MVEILRNKNLATRFQILVEIANGGPNIQQLDIARNLDITPQAISDYIAQLLKEGMLTSEGRSRYKVTEEGINWIIKGLRELRNYGIFVEKAITDMSVCTAVASSDMSEGQTVGLEMKDGLLIANEKVGEGARGITISDANKGDDVGITNIEGIVALQKGKATIIRVPGIKRGGSQMMDSDRVKEELPGRRVVGAIGIEAIVALQKLGVNSVYAYGVVEAAVEAANSGLCPLIVCVDDETSGLIRRLEQEKIDYVIIDVARSVDLTS